MGSRPVFVYDLRSNDNDNDNDREPIPLQMVVSRKTEPHLNNQQRPSTSIYYIKELNPLRMVVLASNSIHLTTTFRIAWISITLFSSNTTTSSIRNRTRTRTQMQCPNPTSTATISVDSNHSIPFMTIALGFDNHNQTRSSIRFEWSCWRRIHISLRQIMKDAMA
jgi:hypothetical protein